MKLLTILFISIISIPSFGQYADLQEKAAHAINLWSSSLQESTNKEHQISDLINQWASIETDSLTLGHLLFNIIYDIQKYDSKFNRIKKQSKRIAPNSNLPDSIHKSDITTIKQNIDLLSLISDEYLESDYPYQYRLDTFLLKQLTYFDIQENEIIADIGSGTGNHILTTAMIYPNNSFILNEIDYDLIRLLKKKIKRNASILNLNNRNIKVIKGNKKHLNLHEKVDKIIVRNTFHHFAKKESMLKSIKTCLGNHGTLIFVEPLKGSKSTIIDCKDTLSYDEIMQYIKEAELEIVSEEIYRETLFLRCKFK